MKFIRYLAHRLLNVDADADKKHLKPVNRHKRIPMKKMFIVLPMQPPFETGDLSEAEPEKIAGGFLDAGEKAY
jgi:hypothetical protein